MDNLERTRDCYRLAKELIRDYQKKLSGSVLSGVNRKRTPELDFNRDEMDEDIRKRLQTAYVAPREAVSQADVEIIIDIIHKELWGYGIIDDYISDESISDVKLYGPDRIRLKKYGKRYGTNVAFENTADYRSFIMRILERNKINLGTANAIQTFTDAGREDALLRITAVSGLLTDSGLPCLAIRKIPRKKADLDALKGLGMFDKISFSNGVTENGVIEDDELEEILKGMVESSGILFTGKGASGKTTLMNALISEIPHDESVMVCQENAELFDLQHPDFFAVHVLSNGADSKISYTLGDLTRAALLMDLDRVIVGEVKEGAEAAGLSKASMTGHKCWTSVHGENCRMAIDKMADYISQATGYTQAESLKQLCGFSYVVHLKNFRVDEIIRIDGWDRRTSELVTTDIYPKKGRQKEKQWWEV